MPNNGFDSQKRWGNSAMKGHGVNSPAMMDARKKQIEAIKKGGHKQGEREVASKKAGFYVQGHKNYGDVYEP